MTDEFVYAVADRVTAMAKERGLAPLVLAVQILITMNPEALQEWADTGFPTSVQAK
jgi:hypothetical protein